MSTPTRTKDTLARYEKVATRLHKKAARSRGISLSDVDPMAIVEDLARTPLAEVGDSVLVTGYDAPIRYRK